MKENPQKYDLEVDQKCEQKIASSMKAGKH